MTKKHMKRVADMEAKSITKPNSEAPGKKEVLASSGQ
jgi:hypothetical protein